MIAFRIGRRHPEQVHSLGEDLATSRLPRTDPKQIPSPLKIWHVFLLPSILTENYHGQLGLTTEITPLLPPILAEREATLAFDLSGDRRFSSGPPTSSTKACGTQNHQSGDGADGRIRVFDATRLLELRCGAP